MHDGCRDSCRFLNDLCDADVLIHVVDVSGSTNEKGEATSGYDPSADVIWLKEEIQYAANIRYVVLTQKNGLLKFDL